MLKAVQYMYPICQDLCLVSTTLNNYSSLGAMCYFSVQYLVNSDTFTLFNQDDGSELQVNDRHCNIRFNSTSNKFVEGTGGREGHTDQIVKTVYLNQK